MHLVLSLLCLLSCIFGVRSIQEAASGLRSVGKHGDFNAITTWGADGRSISSKMKGKGLEAQSTSSRSGNLNAETRFVRHKNQFGKGKKNFRGARPRWSSNGRQVSEHRIPLFGNRQAMQDDKIELIKADAIRSRADAHAKILNNILAIAKRLDAGYLAEKERLKTTRESQEERRGRKKKAGNTKRNVFPQTWASLFQREDEVRKLNKDENVCTEESKRVLKSSASRETKDEEDRQTQRHMEQAEELSKLDIVTYLKRRNEKKENWRPPRPGRSLAEQ